MAAAPPRVRPPAVAGRFFDDRPARCAEEATRLCAPFRGAVPHADRPDDLPDVLYGAMVPHAGWICSGRVAGGTFVSLAGRSAARLFVLTGSVHYFELDEAVTDGAAGWETPLGTVPVDADLRAAIAGLQGFAIRDEAHRPEHSLEVQLPLMQTAFGSRLRIVPCLVPSRDGAAAWGERLGRLLADWPEPVGVIASSDLTHYGRRFRFVPHGTGPEAHRWAREVNDRGLLDLVEALDAEAIVPHARRHLSACGAGAIALTVAACRVLGAERGVVLEHTDSRRELGEEGSEPARDFVGYAGAVFGS